MPKENCRYQIDDQDKIISLGGSWTAFARENGADKLLNHPPLGQSIWRFIEGMSTRNIYHILFEQVRKTGRSVRVPFRCDSPDVLRYMEMDLSAGPDNSLFIQTFLLRVLERDTTPTLPLSHPVARPNTLVQMCAWCSRVLVHDEWHSLEHAIWTLGLLDEPEAPPISHTICPDCVKKLNQEIEQRAASGLKRPATS